MPSDFYRTDLTRFKRALSVALLAAAVAACFPTSRAHAGTADPSDILSTRLVADSASDAGTADSSEQSDLVTPRATDDDPTGDVSAAQADDWSAQAAPDRDDSASPDQGAMAANIDFPPYGSALDGEANAVLDQIAADVGQMAGNILIIGRTDPVEQQRAAALSLGRAQTVAEYLVAHGVDSQRIVLLAPGDTQPLVDPGTCQALSGEALAACLAPDRSVTVVTGVSLTPTSTEE